jgi:hypothetical protein
MTIAAKTKLRIITVSVIGLALLQLFVGRYDFYPFIHWTMFAFKEHKLPSSTVKETVVFAITADGQAHEIKISKLFGAIPSSGGTGKAISERYIKWLRQGNQSAAHELARRAEEDFGIGPITAFRVESWIWNIDVEKFLSGQLPLDDMDRSKKPDDIKELFTIVLMAE